jgi:hypothetical protein
MRLALSVELFVHVSTTKVTVITSESNLRIDLSSTLSRQVSALRGFDGRFSELLTGKVECPFFVSNQFVGW